MAGRKLEVRYEPSGTTAHVPPGTTLFNAAHWAGIPIESTCGGRGTCGKCKVQVLEGHAERTLADYRHVSGGLDEGWRLSCQCEIDGDMVVDVPRALMVPKAATMGVGRFVLLEPNAVKYLLTLTTPTIVDARSRLRRVIDALVIEGLEVTVAPSVLPRLSAVIGDDEVSVITATVVGDRLIDVENGDTTERAFGVSIDVGTTTVVATLMDLRSGGAAAVESTINRQAPFGADVLTRVSHTQMHGPEGLEQLRAAIVATIDGLLGSVCATAGIGRDDVLEVVAAGNATMLHLLLGVDPESIGHSPFIATFLEPQDLRAADVDVEIHPEGRLVLFPSIGAYVGADIVADMLATGVAREPVTRLLVDVGTNGEIVIGNEDRVVTTAAPAGPAFEGGQILHGMRATEGAIEGVVLDVEAGEEGAVRLQVIGGDVEPLGLCGSGLIDIVAQLRLTGLLDGGGMLLSPDEALAQEHPLASRLQVDDEGVRRFALTDDVMITQRDIRELQQAKGAIATGIEAAMRERGLTVAGLDEVLLAGSFGTYIDPLGARVLGLVPPVAVDRIRAVGNTASEGAKMALLSFREREVAFELPGFVEYLELSGVEDFNERFIANVGFPPLELVRPGAIAGDPAP
ncbi:MAG: ASKHA domain-containing protein [Actinomycetota bacterium]|nr:ASKHA domain-containing protein [Actinomycetota bacterium]